MAGLISDSAIDEVKARARIEQIVSDYVTLKPAGMDSLKGLCPFHDEKTPSFHVRPSAGYFHCFGCGESGDVIAFVRKIEHLEFVDAVELLARKVGVAVRYEEGAGRQGSGREGSVRSGRLIDAHRVAEEFYVSQLATPEAAAGRELLAERGFDPEAIAHFRVGYSPKSWHALLDVLRKHGFTEKEISASGLVAAGTRGPYDRFRGRLMWPIRSHTGEPIGFGARKIGDEEGPKYLNTPETMIYKKSQVLYGLDLAKKAIASDHRIVVVEGYTDVMAAHLAGVPYAVATCGTAFGHEHAKIARRLIGDSSSVAAGVILHNGRGFGGEVVFTFDGDAAGKKAALRVFQEDQSFGAQTFVCILPEGLDPCEMRMKYGDAALREVIGQREPLFAFVIRSVLAELPLRTAEGRAAGLRVTAPVVAGIRDRVLRSEYVRQLAGWLGMEEHLVRAAVVQAERAGAHQPAQIGQYAAAQPDPAGRLAERAGDALAEGAEGDRSAASVPVLKARRDIKDPVERIERAALEVIIQQPRLAAAAHVQELPPQTFVVPVHRMIFDAIRAAGSVAAADERMQQLIASGSNEPAAAMQAAGWFVDQIAEQLDPSMRPAVYQLSVEPLPQDSPEGLWSYARGVLMKLIYQGYTRQIADLRSEMQRASADPERQKALFARLIELEKRRDAFSEVDT